MIETIGNGWMWAGFVAFIGVMVAVDMLLLGRQGAHRISAREPGPAAGNVDASPAPSVAST